MTKIEVLKNILKEDETNASIWYVLGLEFVEQGSSSEALKAFSTALQHCDNELKTKIIAELTQLASGLETPAQPTEKQNITNNQTGEPGSLPEDLNETNETNETTETLQDTLPTGETQVNTEREDESSDSRENSSHGKIRVLRGGKSSGSTMDVEPRKPITFEDVGGLTDVKHVIEMKIIKPFSSPGLFQKFRKKVGGGILLYGPPGCGKTFIAKATAGECQARFMAVHISDILDPFLGASEQNLRDIFSSARAAKPCILFFDEIDSLGFNRSKMSTNTMRSVIDSLLEEIEGVDSDTDRLLVIGATNTPWDVDAAFKRPGRFDRMIFVGPPDVEARKKIFQLKLKDRPIRDINFDALAASTELYSGADIENVVEMATEAVVDEIMATGVERDIQQTDLVNAISNSRPSTIDWLRTVRNYVKYANQSGLYNDVEKYLQQYKKLL